MRIYVALLLLALTACAGDIYQEASSRGGVGWRETQLETDRYRITFTGSSTTEVGTVQDYALLRAADLTLAKGRTWFSVVSSAVVEEELNRSGAVYVGPGRRSFGGWLLIEDLGGGRMVATIEIVLGTGVKPTGDPHTYDAQDVANTIRARMKH
jgi:hypothetical protein